METDKLPGSGLVARCRRRSMGRVRKRGRLWRVGWRRRADREMSVAGSTVGCVISPSVTAQARDESGVPAGLRGPQLELVRPVPPADGSGEAELGEAELGEAELGEVEFVVVDLETTGWSPREAAITEIGAVRVRGGQR